MPFPAPRILESDVFPKFHLHGFLVCWWVVLVVLKNLSTFSKVVKSSVVAGQDCGAMKVSTNYPLLTLCTSSHLSPSWPVDNQGWWDIDYYMWDLQIIHNGRESTLVWNLHMELAAWKMSHGGWISGFLDGLADAVDQGLVKAVGVSNYNGMMSLFLSLASQALVEKILRCALGWNPRLDYMLYKRIRELFQEQF
jgi:hypothetical protein